MPYLWQKLLAKKKRKKWINRIFLFDFAVINHVKVHSNASWQYQVCKFQISVTNSTFNWKILICKLNTTWRLILQNLTKLATLHNFSRICNEIIPDLHSCLKQSQWLHELKVYSHVGYGVCVDSKKSVESFNSCSGHIPNF